MNPEDAPPAPPEGSESVFGKQLELAARYVDLLADTGISHGLLGPRERPRLWDRHVLNCAVVSSLFERSSTVADLGSGAGLPGIPLAIARPDLEVTLIEPLLRRTRWLDDVVGELALGNVLVVRGRAESVWGSRRFHYVTARAVAPAAELSRLSLPLLHGGGALHALKGERAVDELASDEAAILANGAARCSISKHGQGVVDPETVVLSVFIDRPIPVPRGLSATDRTSRQKRRPGRSAPAR
jgi:16S rRNA (guanine527-N7)-methyltransferase